MYVPGPNAVDDPMVVLGLLRSAGVGHLVSSESAGALESTVLPFVVDDEMTIDRVEAKRKLSQNRPEGDRAGVVSGLRSSGTRRNGAVADAMEL